MHIDWLALVVVALVSVAATLAFVLLITGGIRLIATARLAAEHGHGHALPLRSGYALLGLAGLLVLFCIYLIVPQFH